jgi:hypothetical protein
MLNAVCLLQVSCGCRPIVYCRFERAKYYVYLLFSLLYALSLFIANNFLWFSIFPHFSCQLLFFSFIKVITRLHDCFIILMCFLWYRDGTRNEAGQSSRRSGMYACSLFSNLRCGCQSFLKCFMLVSIRLSVRFMDLLEVLVKSIFISICYYIGYGAWSAMFPNDWWNSVITDISLFFHFLYEKQVAEESLGFQQGAVGESNVQINCSDSDQGGLTELEKLLKQKTFTRHVLYPVFLWMRNTCFWFLVVETNCFTHLVIVFSEKGLK